MNSLTTEFPSAMPFEAYMTLKKMRNIQHPGEGPAVLVLEYDRDDQPIHVVWGIPKGHKTPAVLITAYRPNPTQWDDSFTRRRK